MSKHHSGAKVSRGDECLLENLYADDGNLSSGSQSSLRSQDNREFQGRLGLTSLDTNQKSDVDQGTQQLYDSVQQKSQMQQTQQSDHQQ